MSEKLIPANASFAAKRGFIRTWSQSIATALASGLTVGILTDAVDKAQAGDWTALAISAVVAVGSPLVNGAQSFFDILHRGIPADYVPEIPPTPAD